ncbi:hypothetical protein, partial [Pseudomonas syringae group genomosp. 7]|uniref:hypothetical protein n=1 Tax=Pseudomonas syringae group genomosp. 7 TaxID=251699 RepID=UPI0037706425
LLGGLVGLVLLGLVVVGVLVVFVGLGGFVGVLVGGGLLLVGWVVGGCGLWWVLGCCFSGVFC